MQARIPNPVATVVGQIIGGHYYNHRRLEALFAEAGAPGDAPEGGCVEKCIAWLKRASADPSVDAFAVLGGVLEHLMEVDDPFHNLEDTRQRIRNILAKYGLTYHVGGRVLGSATATPSRSLEEQLRRRDLSALEGEFQRALANVDTDPPSAITAACAILEALSKIFLEDQGIPLPADQTIKPLWKLVQSQLGLDPAQIADDDLKRILSGLTSIVDGLGAFRTHVGSAHGRGRTAYRPLPRHARLTVHAAHSLALFILETWDARKPSAR